MFPVFDIFISVILGLVEALTEFLPISSTGHLILINQFLKFSPAINENFTAMFEVVIQLGAILAVVVYFRKRLWNIDLWKKVLFAVWPALIIGAIFANRIEGMLFNPFVVSIALIVGGIVLLYAENRKDNIRIEKIDKFSYKKSLIIGFIQCLAMIPGTSRSAATIIGGRLLGASQIAAAEFSFFLAIPTMFAASGYSLLKTGFQMSGAETVILSIGFITSFFFALLVVKYFLQFIARHDFKIFGYYRIILGVFVLIYFILK